MFGSLLDDREIEEEFESHHGYSITVTLWTDGKWTAYIAAPEPHGGEHVLMDNDTEWSDRPDESYLHDLIDERLEP